MRRYDVRYDDTSTDDLKRSLLLLVAKVYLTRLDFPSTELQVVWLPAPHDTCWTDESC